MAEQGAAHADLIVVGGGIVGLAAAYEAAGRGARVLVLEARQCAAMASGWTLGGVRQSGRDPAELPLARAAVARWADLEDELGAPTGYRRRGNLRLARTPAEVERIAALVADSRARGLDIACLDGPQARSLAPALGEAVLGASYCPSDGHADPRAAVAAYAGAARRRGVTIREGCPVLGFVLDRGRVTGVVTADGPVPAGRVLLAAGVHTPDLLAPLGLELPQSAKRVSVLQTAPLPPLLGPVFGVANADCAGRQEIDGRLRVTTGLGPFEGTLSAWTEAGLMPAAGEVADLIARVGALLPALRRARLHRIWGGLIDLTPDALPVLDAPAEAPGLVIGAGFSGHGFGIAPVTGALLADLALGHAPAFDLAPFRLGRFALSERAAACADLTLHG